MVHSHFRGYRYVVSTTRVGLHVRRNRIVVPYVGCRMSYHIANAVGVGDPSRLTVNELGLYGLDITNRVMRMFRDGFTVTVDGEITVWSVGSDPMAGNLFVHSESFPDLTVYACPLWELETVKQRNTLSVAVVDDRGFTDPTVTDVPYIVRGVLWMDANQWLQVMVATLTELMTRGVLK